MVSLHEGLAYHGLVDPACTVVEASIVLLVQVFKPPKLRKSAASDDGSGDTLPVVDSKEGLATARSFNNLAQRNGQSQSNGAHTGSQYPSQAHVQQRYSFL